MARLSKTAGRQQERSLLQQQVQAEEAAEIAKRREAVARAIP